MKSLIYYKGHDIYELAENLKKSSSVECCICLEGEKDKNYENFYDYENKRYILFCDCKPNIHEKCFYNYVNCTNKCVICNKQLIIEKTFKEKLQHKFLYYSFLSVRYLVTISISYCVFQIIKLFFL